MALLVVDVQRAAVERGPYERDVVLENIGALISASRASGVEVIHVQHDGEPGDPDEPGLPGWQIHASVLPHLGEKVVRKRTNSAFRGTDLRTYLEERGVGTLILTGIQTEYCVDTTCRVAYEFGFDILMPELTNTTFDNGEVSAGQIYELYNRRIFDRRFATVTSMDEVLDVIRSQADG
jgi:nicotinamidase-related amidase